MFERTVTYPAAYTHKEASGDPEILIALSWLTRQEPVGRRILVLAPLMTTFEHSEVIRTYGSGLILSSAKNFKSGRPSWQAGPALALWPTTSMTDLLDQHRGTSALAIVPWGLKEIDVWIRARRPRDLLGIADHIDEPLITDPVVKIALEGLTTGVNLSSGLSHPSDKARAVQTFRVLHAAGHTWTKTEIHAWSLAHGWNAHGATELAHYAERIQQGRTFRTTGDPLRPDILDIWRTQANSTAPK